jgi:SAM-dependent methyltransferase
MPGARRCWPSGGISIRNRESWKPGKFVVKRGRLAASMDPSQVGVGSRLFADRVASFFSDSLPEFARGRLADLGCGEVPLYGAYRDLVTDTVCVDWAGSSHGGSHVDVECDLGEAIPLPDEYFDTVILSDVLEHIASPESIWHEMARILKPGGTVLISVPFFYWIHEAPHDHHRFTEYALRRSAEGAGFEVLRLEPLGGVPEILADLLAKNLQGVRLAGKAMASAIQRLAAAFVRTRPGRRLSERTGRAFPLGYAMVARKKAGAREPETGPASGSKPRA